MPPLRNGARSLRRARVQNVNAVAYCAQAVAVEAQAMADGGAGKAARKDSPAPFPIEDVRAYVDRNAEQLRKAGHPESADSLAALHIDGVVSRSGTDGAEAECDRREAGRQVACGGQRRMDVRGAALARFTTETLSREDERGSTVHARKHGYGPEVAGFRWAPAIELCFIWERLSSNLLAQVALLF